MSVNSSRTVVTSNSARGIAVRRPDEQRDTDRQQPPPEQGQEREADDIERERDYVPDGKPDRQEHGEREHRQVPGELPVEPPPVDEEPLADVREVEAAARTPRR